MIRSWVNGRESNSIGIEERALQYGDGVFETMRIEAGHLQYWPQHRQRLLEGVQRLSIQLDMQALDQEIAGFCAGVENGVVKLLVGRGIGGRGYAYAPQMQASRILSLYPLPVYPQHYYLQGIRLRWCETRMAETSVLAGIKHLNRLEHVLARNEWCDEAEEGLMLDTGERVIEGTMSNIFSVKAGELFTPELAGNGVLGVIRGMILQAAKAQGVTCHEVALSQQQLLQADELFVCNSIIGIWPVSVLAETRFIAPGPVTQQFICWLDNNKQEQ